MSNIKTEVFVSSSLDSLEDKVNLYIQKNALLNIFSFKLNYSAQTSKYVVNLVYDVEAKKNEKSNFFFRIFSSDTPEKSNGKLNRFIKDSKINLNYLYDIGLEQITESKAVSYILYKSRTF